MDRWRGKVAVVTGASSGIGVAVVKDLIRHGVKTVALARPENRLNEIRDGLPADQKSLMYPLICDVTKEDDIKSAFAWMEKNVGGVFILVYNAGIMRCLSLLSPDNSDTIRDTIDTHMTNIKNVIGLFNCTREAFLLMEKRNFDDGHVFLVNSLAEHRVPDLEPGRSSNVYSLWKHAVTALTEGYRQKLANIGSKIKVTSISPGLVDREILPPALDPIKPEDVSEAIIYALSTRPHVQVQEITLRPIGADLPAILGENATEFNQKS